jgi:murein DD-endopeptidase MepM/ murein hydrolase activator NlpD
MKRTSAAQLITSARRPAWINGLSGTRRGAMLFAAFVCCGGLMFLLGRSTADVPRSLARELRSLEQDIQLQQGTVDRLRLNNEQSINALAARLAELQAASTRLDALGERLAHMGQLTLDEFDFSQSAAVGGPGDYESMGSMQEDDLSIAIEQLGEKLRQQASQLDALQFLMANRALENDLTPAGWPVRKGWISSRYGERNDPFTGKREQHTGLDFAGTRGTDVLSVASGVVIWASDRPGYGKTVEIDHGNGYRTRYAHSEMLMVKAGDHVNTGQVIALMGSSGRASAPHVHFEVMKDGKRINPVNFVSQLR